MKHEIEAGSGNVFEDLGLPDSDELLVKSKLLSQISDIIHKKRLTQAQTAKILRIDQPKVSMLLKGRVSGFSTDRLIRFLNALNCDVDIQVHRPKATRRKMRRGRTAVIFK